MTGTDARDRLDIYLRQVVAQGATPPADEAAAAAETPVVVDPATAEPVDSSVGDAPALDTTPPADAAPAADTPAAPAN